MFYAMLKRPIFNAKLIKLICLRVLKMRQNNWLVYSRRMENKARAFYWKIFSLDILSTFTFTGNKTFSRMLNFYRSTLYLSCLMKYPSTVALTSIGKINRWKVFHQRNFSFGQSEKFYLIHILKALKFILNVIKVLIVYDNHKV